MAKERFMLRAAVYLMLIKNNDILLLRRYNTGWQDGKYSLVAGHLDKGETIARAMIREAQEEANITLQEKVIQVVHTIHRTDEDAEYIDFFLTANTWQGDIKNLELNKCDELAWYPLDNLPINTLPYIKHAIQCYQNNIIFSEFH